jgi:hypothetical protein
MLLPEMPFHRRFPSLGVFLAIARNIPHAAPLTRARVILMLTLKKTAPYLSEAMQYGLPFAFIEMLRERRAHATPMSDGT